MDPRTLQQAVEQLAKFTSENAEDPGALLSVCWPLESLPCSFANDMMSYKDALIASASMWWETDLTIYLMSLLEAGLASNLHCGF